MTDGIRKIANGQEDTKPNGFWRDAILGDLSPIELAAKLSALFVLLAAFFNLLGWAISSVLSTSMMRDASPWVSTLHPLTASGLVLLGFSLRLSRQEGLNRTLARLGVLLRLGIGATGALILSANAGWFGRGLVERLWPTGQPDFLPTPATGLGLILLAMATLLKRAQRSFVTGQAILGAVGLLSLAGLLAHLYGAATSGSPWLMEAPSALLMLVAALTLLYRQSHRGPLGVVSADSSGRAVARRLLPASILVPIALGWLRLAAETSGLLHPSIGLLAHVLASIAVMAAIVWASATSLARTSLQRQRALQQNRDIESSYRELLDLSERAIFSYNSEGEVTYMNPAAKTLFSIDRLQEKAARVHTLAGAAAWERFFAPSLLGVHETNKLQQIPIKRRGQSDLQIDVQIVHLYRSERVFELLAFVCEERAASEPQSTPQEGVWAADTPAFT